jgi:hypothetical protein
MENGTDGKRTEKNVQIRPTATIRLFLFSALKKFALLPPGVYPAGMKALKMPVLILCAIWTGMSATAKAALIGPLTTSTPISAQADWNMTLSFPQFDPSLGTLNSVELSYTGSFSSTVTVTNDDPSNTSDGGVSVGVVINVQDAGHDFSAEPMMLISGGGGYFLFPGNSTTIGPLSQSGTSDNTYTDPAILSEFTGTGTFALPASTATSVYFSNSGGSTFPTAVTDATLTGTVIYNYTDPAPDPDPLPEPASLALLALALPLLAARRRRRA